LDYTDIRLDHSGDGIAEITICRPEVRNAFRPQRSEEAQEGREAYKAKRTPDFSAFPRRA
ncbi:hypothetical protein ACL02T_34600, partial [Pseudonocardia sp. RS010]